MTASPTVSGFTVAVSPEPGVTVATVGVRLSQVTVLFVAVSGVMVAVIVRLPLLRTTVSLSGEKLTPVTGTAAALTVTLQEAVKLPSTVFTLIVAEPAVSGVTVAVRPLPETDATPDAEVSQVTLWFEALVGATVAVSDRVAPLAVSVSLDLSRETPVTAIVAGAWAFWLIVIVCFKAVLSVA